MNLEQLISQLGYSKNSPFRDNPYLNIHSPEGYIDMSNTDQDLLGIDEYGNKQVMKKGRKKQYKFPGQNIIEVPMAQKGAIITNNPNDPRLKAYQDSLQLFKQTNYLRDSNDPLIHNEIKDILNHNYVYGADLFDNDKNRNSFDRLVNYNHGKAPDPKWTIAGSSKAGLNVFQQNFKKPVQPYVYKKEPKVPRLNFGKVNPIQPESQSIGSTYFMPTNDLNPQLPELPYRVEYTDEQGQNVHKDFLNEKEGTAFQQSIGGNRQGYYKMQKGGKMKKKLKKYQVAGKVKPIITNNHNDPRLRAYQDSLSAYNITQNRYKEAIDKGSIQGVPVYSVADRQYLNRKDAIDSDFSKYKQLGLNITRNDVESEYRGIDFKKGQVRDDAVGYYRFKHKNDQGSYTLADYKKPVQPYVYKKEPEVPRLNFGKISPIQPESSTYLGNMDFNYGAPNIGDVTPTNYGVNYKGDNRYFGSIDSFNQFIEAAGQPNTQEVAGDKSYGKAAYYQKGGVAPKTVTKGLEWLNNPTYITPGLFDIKPEPTVPVIPNPKPLASPVKLKRKNEPETDALHPGNPIRQFVPLSKAMEQSYLNKHLNTQVAQSNINDTNSEFQKSRKKDLNQQYAYTRPYTQTDEQGNLSQTDSDRGFDGQPLTPNAKRFDKGLDHTMTALDVASVVAPAIPVIGKGLQKIGAFLTEETALKNAYKLNPFAFKPNPGMMYRGIGPEGAADALESGVFRAKQNVKPVMDTKHGKFQLNKQFNNTYYTPKFQTADSYGNGFIAEVPSDAAEFNLRYPGGKVKKTWSQSTSEQIPIEKGRILKKDWLQGYKEIPKGEDVYWNGKSYQSTPLSNPQITRGAIDFSQEPTFRANNPLFNADKYNNSYKTPYVEPTNDINLMTRVGTPGETTSFPSLATQEENKILARLQYTNQPVPKNYNFYNSDEIILGQKMDKSLLEHWKRLDRENPDLGYKATLEEATGKSMEDMIKNYPDISPDEILSLSFKRLQSKMNTPNPNNFYQSPPGSSSGAKALANNDYYFGTNAWDKNNFTVFGDNAMLNNSGSNVQNTVLSPNMLNVRPELKPNWNSRAMDLYRKELPKAMESFMPMNTKESLRKLTPNKLGGNIYQKGGYTQRELYDYLFSEDDVASTSAEPTAPDTKEIDQRSLELDQREAELNDKAQYNQALEIAMSGSNPYIQTDQEETPIIPKTFTPYTPNPYSGEIKSSGKYGSEKVGTYGKQIYGEITNDLGYAPIVNSIYRDANQQASFVKQGIGAKNSWHLTGNAIDLKPGDWAKLSKEKQQHYRNNYDVVFHNNHYHIEPKGK